MKNITLSADPDLIEKARQVAKSERKTLNAAFREWLKSYASRKGDVEAYRALMRRLTPPLSQTLSHQATTPPPPPSPPLLSPLKSPPPPQPHLRNPLPQRSPPRQKFLELPRIQPFCKGFPPAAAIPGSIFLSASSC